MSDKAPKPERPAPPVRRPSPLFASTRNAATEEPQAVGSAIQSELAPDASPTRCTHTNGEIRPLDFARAGSEGVVQPLASATSAPMPPLDPLPPARLAPPILAPTPPGLARRRTAPSLLEVPGEGSEPSSTTGRSTGTGGGSRRSRPALRSRFSDPTPPPERTPSPPRVCACGYWLGGDHERERAGSRHSCCALIHRRGSSSSSWSVGGGEAPNSVRDGRGPRRSRSREPAAAA